MDDYVGCLQQAIENGGVDTSDALWQALAGALKQVNDPPALFATKQWWTRVFFSLHEQQPRTPQEQLKCVYKAAVARRAFPEHGALYGAKLASLAGNNAIQQACEAWEIPLKHTLDLPPVFHKDSRNFLATPSILWPTTTGGVHLPPLVTRREALNFS